VLIVLAMLLCAPAWAVANGNGSEDRVQRSAGLLPAAPKRRVSLHRRSENPFGSQYFQSWSAIPLERGEGLYRNMLVSWNAVAYGVTSHFTIGGGLDLYSMLNSKNRSPVWNTRVQVGGEIGSLLHLAGTALHLHAPMNLSSESGDSTVTQGITAAMALLTWGNSNNQLTLGGGWGHNGDRLARGPMFNVAGAIRLFPNVQAVSENWLYVDEGDDLLATSIGIRIVGDHLAIDVGAVYNEQLANQVFSWGMPFVGALLNF
jgi:hypothetical protein